MTFDPKSIRRVFRQDSHGSAPGTYWPLWGGWVTARHVVEQMRDWLPPFATGELRERPGYVDAVVIGGRRPLRPPRAPQEGERVTIYGFPGGSTHLTYRTGKIHFERGVNASDGYSEPTWIVAFDEPPLVFEDGEDPTNFHEPVVVGMSGGPVVDVDGFPLGVLVTRGSPFDSDGNGILEQTADFQALSDIARHLFDEPLSV